MLLAPYVLDMLRNPRLLGMRLAGVTPELQRSFDLFNAHGVVILDPGAYHGRLDIGALQPGDCFFHVGLVAHNVPTDVQSFARQLLENAWPSQADGPGYHRCKVAYEFKRPDDSGSNTQNLLLSPQDIEELRRVATTR
jgi:hypothetical protein